MVYLDHWALNDLSLNSALRKRFIKLMNEKGGTFRLSVVNINELSRMADKSQVDSILSMIESINDCGLINIDPGEVIIGAQVDLSFDSSLIQVDSVTKGDNKWDFFQGCTVNNTSGEITGIGGAILGGTISTPVYLCNISFTAQSTSGTSDLDLNNVIVTDEDGNLIPSEDLIVNNGSVTVGEDDNNPPYESSDPYGDQIWYFIDWGDETNTGCMDPFNSDETIIRPHTWMAQGHYEIKAKAKDPQGQEGPEGKFVVTMPRNKLTIKSLFLRLLEHFPILERMLSIITNILGPIMVQT